MIKYIVVGILTGFLFRVDVISNKTIEYSNKTASKRVIAIILFMVTLAFCYNAESFGIPIEGNDIISGVAVGIYVLIAILASSDCDNPDNNTWLSLVKFVLIFSSLTINSIIIVVISLLLLIILSAVGLYLLYNNGSIGKYRCKIVFWEDIFLCIESMLVFVITQIVFEKDTMNTVVLKVIIDETILHSINYIVMSIVELKLFDLEYKMHQ